MLSYYAKRSTGEGFEKTKRAHEYTSWVHGDAVTPDELDMLVERYGLVANIVRDVRDANELPRVEYSEAGHMYIFLRVPHMSRRGEVSASPLLMVVRGRLFLSLAKGMGFRSETITENDRARLPMSPTQLALQSFVAVVAEYEALIRRTSQGIRDVGRRLRTHDVTNNDFVHFVTIEDNLNEYATNLDGMHMLAQHLRDNRRHAFSDSDEEMIDDILLHIQQLSVTVVSQRQSVTSIRDAYSTIANNTLNKRMKMLTVLTVLIALPNVFYGMYGMNVALPFADEPWAYGAVVLFTFVLIIGVYLLARRFKIF